MTRQETIGPRWRETRERTLKLVRRARDLTDWEQDFVQDLAAKLESWGPRALISAKQLNRLSEIERNLDN